MPKEVERAIPQVFPDVAERFKKSEEKQQQERQQQQQQLQQEAEHDGEGGRGDAASGLAWLLPYDSCCKAEHLSPLTPAAATVISPASSTSALW